MYMYNTYMAIYKYVYIYTVDTASNMVTGFKMIQYLHKVAHSLATLKIKLKWSMTPYIFKKASVWNNFHNQFMILLVS